MNDMSMASAAQSASVQVEIRPLTGDDSHAYRALRQKILDIGDGRYFSDSYEREQKLTTEQLWRDWCTEKREHCIIGTFANNTLAGIMMVTQQGDRSSAVVEWEATWLDPHYRNGGIAKAAYEKVYQWTIDQGYTFAAAFIRADNQRSQDIRKKQGFAYAYTLQDEKWADGSIGDTHAFILDLRASTPELRHQQTIQNLGLVLAFLSQGAHAPQEHISETATVPAMSSARAIEHKRFG
jgi:GNAT superfamily N-acetyltransferase